MSDDEGATDAEPTPAARSREGKSEGYRTATLSCLPAPAPRAEPFPLLVVLVAAVRVLPKAGEDQSPSRSNSVPRSSSVAAS